MTQSRAAGAILTIDLDAVAANWRQLRDRVHPATCAAVVKADGYGLGADRVAQALAAAGCTTFYVALIDEAVALRPFLPEAEIHVLSGPLPGTEPVFAEHRLVPVLNSLEQMERWAGFLAARGAPLAAGLHLDTGMRRLGLPPDELAVVVADHGRLAAAGVGYLMSHLACADEPEHPLNAEQRQAFADARAALPPLPASFANSPGIFLGADYHGDSVRPGVALYGGNPCAGRPNPMAQVVRLQGRILQVRDVDSLQTVGYGATHRVARKGRIATVAVGYADGYLRSLSNAGSGYVGDRRVPVVGRVSMDLITLDVSNVDEASSRPGALVDIIGPHNPVDAVAEAAGTISYEILTSLGHRYDRTYTGDGTGTAA